MQKNSGIVLGLSCCKFLIALGNCFATTDKAKQLKKSKRSNTAIKIINPNATIIFILKKALKKLQLLLLTSYFSILFLLFYVVIVP